jgi:excisionase family DNA binding protein
MLLTIDQAARELAVSRRTVARWIRAGTLPHVRLPGRLVRVAARDVQAIIRRGSV